MGARIARRIGSGSTATRPQSAQNPAVRVRSPSGLLRLLAIGNNVAMQTEPSKAVPPKRKRRWFQYSLRSLLFWIVPYAAFYAAVVSSILSRHGAQAPTGTPGDFLYDLRMAKWEFGEALGAEMRQNMAIDFTLAWIALPILSWAIWRYASRRRNHKWQRVSTTAN
jgi:hypothetical protein